MVAEPAGLRGTPARRPACERGLQLRCLFTSPVNRRLGYVLVVALACALLLVPVGCKKRNAPIIQFVDTPVTAPTVEATMSVQPSSTATAPPSTGTTSTSLEGGSSGAGAPAEAPLARTAPPGNTLWPTKVATFKLNFSGPVWYPKGVPSGFKIDSLNVVEFDPGTGLVCDIVWLRNGKVLQLMQGSPTNRSYPVVSSGKTKWGTETADIVRQDPSDPAAPVIIVYNRGGNFAELSGDLTTSQLKAIAASMVPVK